MRRHILTMVPVMGLLSLAWPASAAAPGLGEAVSKIGTASASPDLLLVQAAGGEKGGGGGAGASRGSGGGAARGGGGGGGSAARSSGGGGGGPAVRSSGGGDGGRVGARSESRTVVRSSGEGERRVRSGDGERRARSGDGDRTRVIVRGGDRDRDRGRGERREGRGTRYVWGGLPFFFYDGYYHGDCSWLKRRYRETGSSYWLARYRQCRDE